MPVVNFQTWEPCELSCKFCLYSRQKKLSDGWSLDDFKLAADKLIDIGIDRFDMTPSLGEITLDPTWLNKIDYIDGRVDYIQIYTHGLNLTEYDLVRLVRTKSPLTLMLSVYGDNETTYKAVTGHDRYDDFIKSLKLIKSFFDGGAVPKHIRMGVDIRFRSIDLPINIRNIDIRNEFWRTIYPLRHNENFLVYNKWENSNWGVEFEDLPNPKEQPTLDKFCDCMNVTLNPNGDAVICDICHPYDERFEVLGNIFEDDAGLIYENLNKVIAQMNQGEFPEVCKICTEYTCVGDEEDYFDGEWKTRPKGIWK